MSMDAWVVPVNLAMGRQRHEDPWGVLISQSRQLVSLRFNKRLFQKIRVRARDSRARMGVLRPAPLD